MPVGQHIHKGNLQGEGKRKGHREYLRKNDQKSPKLIFKNLNKLQARQTRESHTETDYTKTANSQKQQESFFLRFYLFI